MFKIWKILFASHKKIAPKNRLVLANSGSNISHKTKGAMRIHFALLLYFLSVPFQNLHDLTVVPQ